MDVHYMYWTLVFYSSCFCYGSDVVHLNLVEKEIELGKPLHLRCEISRDKLHSNRIWLAGKDEDILCYNGVTSNSAKYEEIEVSLHQYLLKIANLTGNDLNCPYMCRFGFFTQEMILSVNESNFKFLPEEDTTHVIYGKERGNYSLQVMFDKLFPVPTCIANTMPGPRKLTVVDRKENGIFYAVHFSDQSEEPFHNCGSPVEIECTIKDDKYTINHPHSFECSGFNPTSNKISAGTIIGIVIGIVIAIVISIAALTAVIVIYRKVYGETHYWPFLLRMNSG